MGDWENRLYAVEAAAATPEIMARYEAIAQRMDVRWPDYPPDVRARWQANAARAAYDPAMREKYLRAAERALGEKGD